ncbi:MAG: hypothetical protein U9N87_08600 [Planctomycetota bacterium]|nr:hypothetical protein [Planctomycetota bacterium]
MIVNKTSSVEEYQIASRFDSLRKILKTEEYSQHLEKPLAYWALPTDRRLPLVLLGRTLGDLLEMPFAELTATPGIGQKKIRSFVSLLSRAANTDPTDLSVDDIKPAGNGSAQCENETATEDFDPSTVSEVVWSKWRATIVNRGFEDETLGRLAPNLRGMTRVNWNARLGEFTGHTLAEIKARKTHGEKRMHALLEIFHGLHKLLSNMGNEEHLVVRVCPHRIDAVQQWVAQTMQATTMPDKTEIFEQFVKPLLDQLHVDATEQIANLADDRVGLSGPITSVREVARRMNLTRARVYQLLNEINDIMQVRWPTGRCEIYELLAKFEAEANGTLEQLDQFRSAMELFYPNNRRCSAELLVHSEPAEDNSEPVESGADVIGV